MTAVTHAEAAARGQIEGEVPDEAGAAPHAPADDASTELVEVFIPAGKVAETAKALNDAAVGEENLVQWTDGTFTVPKRIADAADLPDAADSVVIPDQTEMPVRTIIEPIPRKVEWTPENGPDGTPNHIQEDGSIEAAGNLETGDPRSGLANAGDTGDVEPTNAEIDAMKVDELHAYARDNDIDLRGATLKADIAAAIKDSKRS